MNATVLAYTTADEWPDALRAQMEASDAHATDVTLIGTCRKCEQNDPTYRYDDCPVTYCDCGNVSTELLITGEPACEFCYGHRDCVAPDTIATGVFGWAGDYIAKCSQCSYVCAYWECACELDHDCVAN